MQAIIALRVLFFMCFCSRAQNCRLRSANRNNANNTWNVNASGNVNNNNASNANTFEPIVTVDSHKTRYVVAWAMKELRLQGAEFPAFGRTTPPVRAAKCVILRRTFEPDSQTNGGL